MIKENNQPSVNKKQLYQLVLMDCNMPIMDGYTAQKYLIKLINKGKIDFVPIVACTADVSNDNEQRCLRMGFDDILFKPVSKQALKKILGKFCRKE